jgi:hypothetical protein
VLVEIFALLVVCGEILDALVAENTQLIAGEHTALLWFVPEHLQGLDQFQSHQAPFPENANCLLFRSQDSPRQTPDCVNLLYVELNVEVLRDFPRLFHNFREAKQIASHLYQCGLA